MFTYQLTILGVLTKLAPFGCCTHKLSHGASWNPFGGAHLQSPDRHGISKRVDAQPPGCQPFPAVDGLTTEPPGYTSA